MSTLLRLSRISKRYRAGIPGCGGVVTALRDCSLDVDAGESVGILGRPGSGKSTLLLCAAGLLRPDGGEVTWCGDPAPPAPHEVVYVPEHASNHRFLTVRETLEHAALRDAPPPVGVDPIGSTLAGAGLQRQAHLRVARLSRGASVRLTIARALLARPRLLLLDETLTALTGRERSEVEDVLLALARGSTAVLVASGDPRALARVCTRVVRLELGQIRGELTDAELGATSPRALELQVEMSRRVESLVNERLLGLQLGGGRILLPLGERSCEETLADCRALGITVRSSRVVEWRQAVKARLGMDDDRAALTPRPGAS